MTTTSKKRSPNKLELFDSNCFNVRSAKRWNELELEISGPKMAPNEAQVWLSLRLKIGLV